MDFPLTRATQITLKSGLELILLPDAASSVVSVQAWVRTGSIHEEEFTGTGISHLLEHLVFKGTKNFDTDSLSQAVQAAGGQWNAYTTYDRTVYYLDGPAENAEFFTQVIAEMVFHPRFPEDEFERERDVIRREIEMGLDQPGHHFHQLLFQTLYRIDHRRHPVIGYREQFDRLSLDDVRQYHARRYTPNNVFMTICGNFDPAKITALLEDWSTLPPRPLARAILLPSEPAAVSTRFASAHFAVPATQLCLAWRTPGIGSKAAIALNLLSSILGSGASSLLFQEFREKRELALEISAWCYESHECDGIFAISAMCQPEQSAELAKALLEFLNSLTLEQIEACLQKAKRQSLSSQFGSLLSMSGQATDLSKNWFEARQLDFTRIYVQQLNQLSAQDLLNAAHEFLDPQLTHHVELRPNEVAATGSTSESNANNRQLKEIQLQPGISLVLLADRRIPLVKLDWTLAGGQAAELANEHGVSQLWAQSVLKGTSSRNANEIASCLEDLGGGISAYAARQSMGIRATCLSEDVSTALDLGFEVLRDAIFPDDAIAREKELLLTSLRFDWEDPLTQTLYTAREFALQGSPYALPLEGTEASLASLTPAQVAAFHRDRLSSAKWVICASGDFDPAEMEAMIRQRVTHFQTAGQLPQPALPVAEFGKSHNLDAADKQQAVLALLYPGLTVFDQETDALQLLTSYLSDMAGPLFKRIREDLGLAYYVKASSFLGLNVGTFGFYLGTSLEQLDLAERELKATLQTLCEQGMSNEEFQRAQVQQLSSYALASQSHVAIARGAALDVMFGHPAERILTAEARIRDLTVSQVNALAQRLLKAEPTLVRFRPH